MRYLLKTRREIIYEASKGYDKLSKKEKAERLDNLVAIMDIIVIMLHGYSPGMIDMFMLKISL